MKLRDVEEAVAYGADEIDMVINRGAFLSGRYAKVFDEIVRVEGGVRHRAPQGHPRDRRARARYDHVRTASLLAMAAGADFIKTSTGKLPSAATLPVRCACSRRSATSTTRPAASSA